MLTKAPGQLRPFAVQWVRSLPQQFIYKTNYLAPTDKMETNMSGKAL
jgi:hypothetical protein